MKQADISEFIGAQFFFESMTRKAMKEYGMTGNVESMFLALTETTADDGSKQVVGTKEMDNPFDKDGIDFLLGMVLHAAKKAAFVEGVGKRGHTMVALFERHLFKNYKGTGKDAIHTIHTFAGNSIKRVFIVEKNEMSIVNGEIANDMVFNEDCDD